MVQYHASLINADGAYHCPVGSIMAIFTLELLINRSSILTFIILLDWIEMYLALNS